MNPACTDAQLEARYLGGAMLDPRILEEHPLPPGCFGLGQHREIHAAMCAVHLRGDRVTEDRLDSELADLGYHAARATQPFQLAVALPDDPDAVCERLRMLAARRAIVEGCDNALRMLSSGKPLLAVQAHLARLAELDVVDEDRTIATPIATIAAEAMVETRRAADDDARHSVITGIPGLDESGVDLDRGDLGVIAGDSGAGKSSTMLAMARAQAAVGERVLIVTLEDGRTRWGRRAVHGASGVPIRALKKGDLSAQQWAAADDAARRVATEAVWLSAPLSGTLDEVMHAIRRARAQHGITIAYVDYIQAIACEDGDQAMRHHIRDCLEAGRRETARGAEPLTIIYGSQYRKRDNEALRPRNADLFEASYIHQKADVILHLWKDEDANRFWWLGKHKDEDPRQGKLVRDPTTGLLGGGTNAYAGPAPEQAAFDGNEWREGVGQ